MASMLEQYSQAMATTATSWEKWGDHLRQYAKLMGDAERCNSRFCSHEPTFREDAEELSRRVKLAIKLSEELNHLYQSCAAMALHLAEVTAEAAKRDSWGDDENGDDWADDAGDATE